jgi:hypothetical protein
VIRSGIMPVDALPVSPHIEAVNCNPGRRPAVPKGVWSAPEGPDRDPRIGERPYKEGTCLEVRGSPQRQLVS